METSENSRFKSFTSIILHRRNLRKSDEMKTYEFIFYFYSLFRKKFSEMFSAFNNTLSKCKMLTEIYNRISCSSTFAWYFVFSICHSPAGLDGPSKYIASSMWTSSKHLSSEYCATKNVWCIYHSVNRNNFISVIAGQLGEFFVVYGSPDHHPRDFYIIFAR